jgi:hypothetical protein
LRILLIILIQLLLLTARAQTIGGSSAYNFLKLPSGTLLTGTGGVNVSYNALDAGLAANNPALLQKDLSGQLGLSFNSFLGGIKTYSLSGAYHYDRLQTTLGGQVYFVDYGSIPQTDAAGNSNGNFHPVDFAVQLSASGKYLERWSYGATIKFIHSGYQLYSSSAVAFDAGVLYSDTANNFTAGFLAKNMGFQLKTYAGEAEDLPFDLQIGITKKLANAPLGFSFTAQHVHQFNLFYNDSTFNNENGFDDNNKFFTKLLNHFVIAGHIFLSPNLEAVIGYNHLRRNELNIGTTGNGLNGFSAGLRVKFQKLQVLYSRSNYQRNISYNQIGINLQMDKLFGLGE